MPLWSGLAVLFYRQRAFLLNIQHCIFHCYCIAGLLTDRQHEEMSIVVDFAIENANNQYEIALAVIKDQVPYGNSFLSYGRLCRMMEVKQLPCSQNPLYRCIDCMLY